MAGLGNLLISTRTILLTDQLRQVSREIFYFPLDNILCIVTSRNGYLRRCNFNPIFYLPKILNRPGRKWAQKAPLRNIIRILLYRLRSIIGVSVWF